MYSGRIERSEVMSMQRSNRRMVEEELEPEVDLYQINLGSKDKNRLREDIVFSHAIDSTIADNNDDKDIELFQGATIIGKGEQAHNGDNIEYIKILNTNPNTNTSTICFIRLINNAFHYYKDQESLTSRSNCIKLNATKHRVAFGQLLRFYEEIDFVAIRKETLSDETFKTINEIECRNDLSNFSGFIAEPVRNGDEVVLASDLFCDGTYVKRKSKYMEGKEVNFLNIRSEDGTQNISIRISPIGDPIHSYSIEYSNNGVSFKKFNNNDQTIKMLYKYQLTIDKASASAYRRIDIPRQVNIITRPSQEAASEIKPYIKKSFWQRLSKLEKITMALMVLIAISAISATAFAFFIPSFAGAIVTLLSVGFISSTVAAFAPLLILIPIIFITYSLYYRHKDSSDDSANNRANKHILNRLGLSSGAVTVLGLILLHALFPEALIIAAIVGFSITASSLLASWLLKKEDINTPRNVIENANKNISKIKNNILTVVNLLSFMSVITYGVGIIFSVAIITNPIFFIAGITIFVITFMLRNLLRNQDFKTQLSNILTSVKDLGDITTTEGVLISEEDQKKAYHAYREYLSNKYDNRFFQLAFSFMIGGGIATLALTLSFPLGMLIPISLPILGLLMVVFSLLNYSRMTKQCQIARKPLDYLQDELRKEQMAEIETIKTKYATISQGLNIFIAADIVAIVLFSTVFSITVAIPLILLASLAILLILNIWLKYKEYNLVSEKTKGLWTTSSKTESNQVNLYSLTNAPNLEHRLEEKEFSSELLGLEPFKDHVGPIFDMNSPYANLIANNRRISMLYDARKNRVLFSTPEIDDFVRDMQGNPVNNSADLNNINIEINGEIKLLDLTAPSLEERAMYHLRPNYLLLIDGKKILGFVNKNTNQYMIYKNPVPRISNTIKLMEKKYSHRWVRAQKDFDRDYIVPKLKAERDFTKFMIGKMSSGDETRKYRDLYKSVMDLYFKFLTEIDNHMYTTDTRHYFTGEDELEPLEIAHANFKRDVSKLIELDREGREHTLELAERTFQYFDNYQQPWLTKGHLNIAAPLPENTEFKELQKDVSEPIKDNSREKYILALDKKKSDIKSIVAQPLIAIPDLPANKLYPHSFMEDKAEYLIKIRKEIIAATVGMNKAEQEIIQIIFLEIINSTYSEDHEDLLQKAKSRYAAVKKTYANYCSQMNECYQRNYPIEEIEERMVRIGDHCELESDNEDLKDAFIKLKTKTQSYYTSQAKLRALNEDVLLGKNQTEIKDVEKDISIIKAEKIDFAKMPSLKAEEIRVNLIIDYVDSSNKGIFTRIKIAALFVPVLTTGLLFAISAIINVALLSNPIGWVIISSSLLITIAIMASSKIALQISTLSTGKFEHINFEQIDQNIFINRVIKAIFSDNEERTEDNKIRVQPRTKLSLLSFTLFGLGGITLITLGLFVFSSLSWIFIPVGVALVAVQIPIAFMKIYANKRITEEGFIHPQSKFLTFLPIIISTFATTAVIGFSVIVATTTIGLLPFALYFAGAFLIFIAPLAAQGIYKYLYNKASRREQKDLDKKFGRVVVFSSIISFVGTVAGFALGFTGLLPFSFFAIPVALSVLFIFSFSYFLYKLYKNREANGNRVINLADNSMLGLRESFRQELEV